MRFQFGVRLNQLIDFFTSVNVKSRHTVEDEGSLKGLIKTEDA